MDRDLLETYVNQGLSLTQLTEIFNKGKTTLRYWLKKYNLKTEYKSFKEGYRRKSKVGKERQHCSSCKIKLNEENSYYIKIKKIYTSKCKSCQNNDTANRRKKFKKFCIDYKGGSCIKCGYNEVIAVMDFHHLNPNEKELEPSRMMNKSQQVIQSELDKCVLLCANCHREEHHRLHKIKGLQKSFAEHLFENFSDSILTGKNTNLPSCQNCDVIFERKPKSKCKTRICKSCDSKLVVEKTVINKINAVEFMGGKCSSCGYDKCIRALEFHHLDPTLKSPNYNKRFKTWGIEKKKEELKNCILVCANCHRKIHSVQR